MHDRTPDYVFTIPSLADNIALDCRIYHPQSFEDVALRGMPKTWQTKGAVVAHPYSPLGGCMDDPVVMTVVEQLLDLDFVVGTFNFRGAAGSKGSTSWTGRAEREDYISFVGFLVHYLNQLRLSAGISPHTEQHGGVPSGDTITLILGGYSYGSLIVTQLPEINSLLHHVNDSALAASSNEILLRARNLAAQTTERSDDALQHRGRREEPTTPSARGHRKSTSHHSIILGGQETPLVTRNLSDESGSRRSVDLPGRIKDRMVHHHSSSRSIRKSSSHSVLGSHDPKSHLVPVARVIEDGLPHVDARYLLISPLLPPLSGFLSMSLSAFMFKTPEPDILINNPTLVVFGTEDGFTSAKRMRAWCKRMERRSGAVGGAFTWHEQERAGHFWREGFVLTGMMGVVEGWAGSIVGNNG